MRQACSGCRLPMASGTHSRHLLVKVYRWQGASTRTAKQLLCWLHLLHVLRLLHLLRLLRLLHLLCLLCLLGLLLGLLGQQRLQLLLLLHLLRLRRLGQQQLHHRQLVNAQLLCCEPQCIQQLLLVLFRI